MAATLDRIQPALSSMPGAGGADQTRKSGVGVCGSGTHQQEAATGCHQADDDATGSAAVQLRLAQVLVVLEHGNEHALQVTQRLP